MKNRMASKAMPFSYMSCGSCPQAPFLQPCPGWVGIDRLLPQGAHSRDVQLSQALSLLEGEHQELQARIESLQEDRAPGIGTQPLHLQGTLHEGLDPVRVAPGKGRGVGCGLSPSFTLKALGSAADHSGPGRFCTRQVSWGMMQGRASQPKSPDTELKVCSLHLEFTLILQGPRVWMSSRSSQGRTGRLPERAWPFYSGLHCLPPEQLDRAEEEKRVLATELRQLQSKLPFQVLKGVGGAVRGSCPKALRAGGQATDWPRFQACLIVPRPPPPVPASPRLISQGRDYRLTCSHLSLS